MSFFNHKKTKMNDDASVYLLSCVSDAEADIIENMLNASGIPVLTKRSDLSGSYGAVLTAFGSSIDIFVPESEVEKAREILAAMREDQ